MGLGKLFQKTVIVSDAFSIGIEHHERYAPCTSGTYEVQNPRMDGWLSARKLNYLGVPLGTNKVVEHCLDLFHRKAEAGPRIGKAERTIHVAGAVHLNNAQAGVLLMVGAQSAVVRASILDFGPESQRDRPRLVEPGKIGICLCVAVDKRFERPTLGAALGHVDLVVAQQDLCIDHFAAIWTNTPRELVEDVICVFLGPAF